eukprot:CAMPEP_0196729518 /NCGR_PEP_ID=MMETSP1091-20130531/9893_1 /TAXON_ID=302021 /ORGANISM="Rhodomonas sp., Strain CCMP768" /LENGTH=222 /DNA_ID=CAMNT_0042072419 /DNA_START=77 /DNA_END=747 /DNA_ORIENTATION=-
MTSLAFIIAFPFVILKLSTSGTRTFTKLEEFSKWCNSLPLGGWLVTFASGCASPYTAPIRARFVKVSAAESIVEMDEWSWLRNPFKSLHACALSNLGEACATLTGFCAMQAQKGVRIIPVAINSSYLKKARGTVRATCRLELPSTTCKHEAVVDITDRKEAVVCQVRVVFDVKVDSNTSDSTQKAARRARAYHPMRRRSLAAAAAAASSESGWENANRDLKD